MIRQAKRSEAEVLTQLSFASKRYWGYPEAYFKVWASELTISADYIDQNDVVVYEYDGCITAYYSIVQLPGDIEVSGVIIKKGFWLEHMFVKPESIGRGIGTRLFHHLHQRCPVEGIVELGVLADPNAKGFYEKMGCAYQKEHPSTIENRSTPYLVLHISEG